MKFQILSDLHREFEELDIPQGKDESNSYLILAGDIYPFKYLSNYKTFLMSLSKRFKGIFLVIGNHEFYGTSAIDISKNYNKFVKELTFDNVICLQNKFVEVEGIRILGTTLWTDFDKNDPIKTVLVSKHIADFFAISGFTADIWLSMHKKAMKFLEKHVIQNSIVITHHAPSIKSVVKKYERSLINTGFYANADNIIYNKSPKLWVHGHMHDQIEYYFEETRVICNPLGYPTEKTVFDRKNILAHPKIVVL